MSLIGIWLWQKRAAQALILLIVVEFILSIIVTRLDDVDFSKASDVFGFFGYLVTLLGWLALWIKALRVKWTLFK